MKKTIKLCDGFKVIHSEGIIETQDFRGIFTDLFHWDLENDQLAKDCYDVIFREVFCFGRVDLTQFTDSKRTLIIEAIPPTEPIITEAEE